jgi:hypothetical protein
VRNQRFRTRQPKLVTATDLDTFTEGSYAEPLNGTLVKMPNDATVYYMQTGLRRPLTLPVFLMRGFQFGDVVTLTNVEVGSWIEGSFFTPPNGSLIRSVSNPTVYWVVDGALRPINYGFYIQRKLNSLPIITMPDGDIAKFPKGNAYTL